MMVKKPASLLAVATRSGRGRYYGLPGDTMALPSAPPGREPEPPGLDGRIVRIAVPSLFALALDPILNVVDTAFVGLGGGGAAPLAAVSASTSFFGFVLAHELLRRRRARRSSPRSSSPAAAARPGRSRSARRSCGPRCSWVWSSRWRRGRVGPAMDLFAPAYELHGAAVDFSRLRALSAPAVVAAAALNGSLRGLGDASSALKAASLAAVVNVLLDIALIYGLGMNPNGAAIATACAEYAAAAYLGAVFLSRRRARRRRRRGGARPGAGASTFATAAAYTLVRTASLQIFLAATTAYIGTASADPAAELAAHLVLKQFYLVLSFATDALAVAAQQLVASAPDAAAARALLTSDAAVAAAAEDELRRVVAPLQVLSSLVFVGDGVLQGSRDFTFGRAVSAAALVAAATLFAPVDGRDALSAAWDAIAVLNGCRFSPSRAGPAAAAARGRRRGVMRGVYSRVHFIERGDRLRVALGRRALEPAPLASSKSRSTP
ncbi:hypothetical protein JL722_4971 [Aureococcus anophagefferens]|nr:hypothetical protein JL722_4971 [Aureococcus anophagefferens]